jgi:tRNA(Ile)-lysidine synthase
MQQQFEQYIAVHRLFRPDYRLLVAVSGGVDSMLLCELLRAAAFPFAIAHANFQLRGDASNDDAAFVRQYAEQHQIVFFEKHFDTADFAQNAKLSIQTAARQLRYEWFENLITNESFDFLLTAHHAHDNLETALHHLARGTGLRGLSAMSPKSEHLVRPLLWATKAEIMAHAEKIQLEYREDVSNASDKYTRNFIRHHIVPAMEKVNVAAVKHSVSTLEQLQETVELLDFLTEKIRQTAQTIDENGNTVINRILLNEYAFTTATNRTSTLILYEMLRPFGFNAAQIQDIAKVEHTGAIFESPKFQLLINRVTFVIEKKAKTNTRKKIVQILDFQTDTIFFGEQYRLETQTLDIADWTMHPTQAYAQLDLDTLTLPLTLRPCYEGDAFEPLGMTGKRQKLSDFFNNNKISRFDKARTWVLVNADGRIVWVIGQRIADSFKVTAQTQRVFLLHKRNDD